ncbi:HAD-IIIA family hydrolase [Rhodospirillales bacterium]|nr:HAD-IIIA family hydrolase [Rhodospirillales bacterium]
MTLLRPAVFLDRDGVLNSAVVREGKPYPPQNLADVEITRNAQESVQRIRDAGFVTVIVTNQPDVAKGIQTRDVVDAINNHVMQETGVEHLRVCWCLEGGECDCYKPKPGMLVDAARELHLDLSQSFMVGDRWRDVGAGINAGCTTVLIERGYQEQRPFTPDFQCSNLSEATDYILK